MNFKYLNSVICLCLTLALVVSLALASDTKEDAQGLSHYIVGVYCEDLGDLDRAMQEYQAALVTDPDSALLHLNLASIFIKKDDAKQAISQLKQAIGIAPEAVEPHAILALVYAAQKQVELASQEYTLALKNASKLEPKNIEIYKSLGAIYLQQGKLKEAESIFKIITGLSADDPQAHLYLGSIYFDLKDYSSVEKELKTALKLKPDYQEALNFLGYFYLEQDKNIDAAGKMIKKALVLEPDNGAYIDSLGWFYFKKGRFKEALNELEKAASLMSDPVIYDHLGDVFLKLGNQESAKLNWEKSLKLDSTQEKIKTKLFKLTNNGK
ncbi:MAG: tetratricopeptide repeat protein [Candidatus Omnitrophica bacterium]|nr:tetratricopeptide repeat protein [Candidatus Omnitrophota bacterium]